ncbi:MAG: uroporphyrinogen decarboxylase [Gammaproteobacteria bacterium]|nr:uroporphyrinogen decarboxylase [Gammaproteobacteria bacterium]
MKSALQNNAQDDRRLISAMRRQPVDRPPVWLMRQAGRYLPEYQKLRASCPNFVEFCLNPELVCQATLQPIERFGLDAAIIFSDILILPMAIGFDLTFEAGSGPRFTNTLSHSDQIPTRFDDQIEQRINEVYRGVKTTRQALSSDVPLLGFAGAPWTVASYLIEGKSSATFSKPRRMLYEQPDQFDIIIDRLARLTAIHLKRQISAGVDAVMLFDSWAGLLDASSFSRYSAKALKLIVDELRQDPISQTTPIIVFCKGAGQWLAEQRQIDCDVIGIDWQTPMSATEILADTHAIQGNLDPALLYADEQAIVKTTTNLLETWGNKPGLIVNLGHGIYPDVSPDAVATLVNTVKQFRY